MTSRGMGGSFGSNPRQPHRRQQLSCNSLAAPSERGPQRNCPSPQYCLSPYYAPQSRKTPATGSHQRRGVWGGGGHQRLAQWGVVRRWCSLLSSSVASRHYRYRYACVALRRSNGRSVSASHTSTHPTHPTGRGPGFSPAPQITAAWPLGHAGTGNAGS